ncbi:unnamed protein product [Cylicocyclus nassatus]|uniref:ATP-citrate synthase citrate-binding domain-containing protein n=1 Tax=Cylicocyclus nassatus TaxID=53992 RepID=A0AA36GWV9_CYLNA|nr:unnamed protein product [Cylicocyclus nassatus]
MLQVTNLPLPFELSEGQALQAFLDEIDYFEPLFDAERKLLADDILYVNGGPTYNKVSTATLLAYGGNPDTKNMRVHQSVLLDVIIVKTYFDFITILFRPAEEILEEAYIVDVDSKRAPMDLTVLNKKGKIWTMAAGGVFFH